MKKNSFPYLKKIFKKRQMNFIKDTVHGLKICKRQLGKDNFVNEHETNATPLT